MFNKSMFKILIMTIQGLFMFRSLLLFIFITKYGIFEIFISPKKEEYKNRYRKKLSEADSRLEDFFNNNDIRKNINLYRLYSKIALKRRDWEKSVDRYRIVYSITKKDKDLVSLISIIIKQIRRMDHNLISGKTILTQKIFDINSYIECFVDREKINKYKSKIEDIEKKYKAQTLALEVVNGFELEEFEKTIDNLKETSFLLNYSIDEVKEIEVIFKKIVSLDYRIKQNEEIIEPSINEVFER